MYTNDNIYQYILDKDSKCSKMFFKISILLIVDLSIYFSLFVYYDNQLNFFVNFHMYIFLISFYTFFLFIQFVT